MYLTLPSATSSCSAAMVSSTGVTGSGVCNWYRSMWSVRSRRNDSVTARRM